MAVDGQLFYFFYFIYFLSVQQLPTHSWSPALFAPALFAPALFAPVLFAPVLFAPASVTAISTPRPRPTTAVVSKGFHFISKVFNPVLFTLEIT
jgi:hypothetical protein